MHPRKAVVLMALMLSVAVPTGAGSRGAQSDRLGSLALTSRAHAASQSYKRKADLASLLVLLPSLKPGTPRHDVEALLGQPSHTPLQVGNESGVYEPQVYYGTQSECWHESLGRPAPCTLVINYYTPSRFAPTDPPVPEALWDTIENLSLGPVGE